MRELLRRLRGHWSTVGLTLAIGAALVVIVAREPSSPGLLIESREPLPGVDELRVSVAGAVADPGVVTLQPGARVSEAIAGAGGPADDADETAVNLARRVVDGEQIFVPFLGEAAAALVDVNHADAWELEALPGIGPVYATRVIEARTREGPFATTDALVEREVIPAHVYEQIRDRVTAR
jgi:competence protein ComEA